MSDRVFRYTVDKLNVIRTQIAGYHGDAAITRELVQNADDAGATSIQFTFLNDRLIVRNDSVFTDEDLDAICNIASGHRRSDDTTTGAWGTGFLSVYQITDAPELRSAGIVLCFDPRLDELTSSQSDVTHHTEFHLPWRMQRTEISYRIEADIWDVERIDRLFATMAFEIYRVMPFLRNITHIAMLHGENLSYDVRRKLQSHETLPTGATHETWSFEARDHVSEDHQIDTWHIIRGQSGPLGFEVEGQQVKTPNIAIGITTARSWLNQPVPGTLYNFLPTPTPTGFGFHIQGDFFPDANRTGILTEESEKGFWNMRVLRGIAELFSENLLTIRDVIAPEGTSATTFYRLFPVHTKPASSSLQVIPDVFKQRAAAQPIIRTTDGRWTEPRRTRMPSQQLWQVVKDHLPNIVPGLEPAIDASMKSLLIVLGATQFGLPELLDELRNTVQPGVALHAAPTLVNNRERLDAILEYVRVRLDNPRSDLTRVQVVEMLEGVPLVLRDDGTLHSFSDVEPYLASHEVRAILPEDSFWLVDLTFQDMHERVLTTHQGWIEPVDVVNALADCAESSVGRAIVHAHPSFNSWDKLIAIFDFLATNREALERESSDLSQLALCPDERGILYSLGNGPYLPEPDAVAVLDGAGISYVASELASNPDYCRVLKQGGIRRLSPESVMDILETACPAQMHVADAPHWLGDVRRLQDLYRYFNRHAGEMAADTLSRLRKLPFVLTQGGQLTAVHRERPLLIPPAQDDAALAHDLLGTDNLISTRVLDGETRHFFEQVLDAQRLTTATYIESIVLPRYNQSDLCHDQRLELLTFIRNSFDSIQDWQNRHIIGRIQEAPLIRCRDDEYRRADDVYLPSEELDSIFPNGYPSPHPAYEVGESRQAPASGNSGPSWYWFFRRLGVRLRPRAHDVVAFVRDRVDNRGPNADSIADVRRVYDFLNQNWESFAGERGDLEPLRSLAWLPSSNDDSRWFVPSELFEARLEPLVGSQVPLNSFRQAGQDFGHFLGIRTTPLPHDVVNHLLHLSRTGRPATSYLYAQLGRYSDEQLRLLRDEHVIYDAQNGSYWHPYHVFIGNHSREFGGYRCYIDPTAASDALELYRKLGVRQQPHDYADHLDLLDELAEIFEGRPVDPEGRRLIEHAFSHLGSRIERDSTPPWIPRLKRLSIIPDQDGRLHAPDVIVINDQDEILKKFSPGQIRYFHGGDEATTMLLSFLGVRLLTRAIRRDAVFLGDTSTDDYYASRLKLHVPHFRRIVATLKRTLPDGWNDPADFTRLVVQRARDIRIRYAVDQATGIEESAEAWFHADRNTLYIRPDAHNRISGAALATEISHILNPSVEPATIVPVITMMLDLPINEADDLLTRMQFSQISESAPDCGEDLLTADEPRYATIGVDEGHVDLPDEVPDDAPAPIVESPRLPNSAESTQSDEADSVHIHPTGIRQTPLELVPQDAAVDAVAEIDHPAQLADTPENAQGDELVSETSNLSDNGSGEQDVTESPSRIERSIRGASTREREPREPNSGKGESAHGKRGVPFHGPTRPLVPTIGTDWGALHKKYGVTWHSATQAQSEMEERFDTETESDERFQFGSSQRRVTEVRFVLTFMNVTEGFLSLTQRAAEMLQDSADGLNCTTDFGMDFPLYIDWRRRVIHNAEALPKFFAANDIPAGGIVYLEHRHGDDYRLYFKNPSQQRIHNVRIAELQADSSVTYTEISSVDLNCETEEWVFRAEKRLEDPGALFAEAVGKRSVFQTICDVLASSSEQRLHEDEIVRRVFLIRMVSRHTIAQELRRRPCFVADGRGYWRFDPERVGERPREAPSDRVRRGTKPTEKRNGFSDTPVDSNGHGWDDGGYADDIRDHELEVIARPGAAVEATPIERIRTLLKQLGDLIAELAGDPVMPEVLRQLRAIVDRSPVVDPVATTNSLDMGPLPELVSELLDRLRRNVDDSGSGGLLADELRRILLEEPYGDPRENQTLCAVLASAGDLVRELYLDPVVLEAADDALTGARFTFATHCLLLIQEFSGRSQAERISQLQARKDAWEYLQLVEESQDLREQLDLIQHAIDADPSYGEAVRLQKATTVRLLAEMSKHVIESIQAGTPVLAASALMGFWDEYMRRSNVTAVDPNTVRKQVAAQADRIQELIAAELNRRANSPEDRHALTLSLVAMYHLPVSVDRSTHRHLCANALLDIALSSGGNTLASILLAERAITVGNTGPAGSKRWSQFSTARLHLAELYAAAGEWNCAWRCWKMIEGDSLAPLDVRQRARQSRIAAAQRIGEDKLSIGLARETLIQELERIETTGKIRIGDDEMSVHRLLGTNAVSNVKNKLSQSTD